MVWDENITIAFFTFLVQSEHFFNLRACLDNLW